MTTLYQDHQHLPLSLKLQKIFSLTRSTKTFSLLFQTMNTQPILKNIFNHIQLNPKEVDYFISLLHYKKLKRKEFLLRQDEMCKHINYVIDGCLRVYKIDDKGIEHIIVFAMEDWWIADLPAFLTQTPATYFIDAVEKTELFQIEKSELEKAYKQVPKLERYFRILHQNAFVSHLSRLEQFIFLNAKERYIQLQKKFPALENRVPQKHIASYLGITPEFLSMLRRKLARG